jgi:glycosyltransferase involved in cell wall biosynthesis
MTRVDVIVAVRDEEQSIPVFLDRIAALQLPEGVDLIVIFVEDSSTDGTRPLLRRLAEENPHVGYYTVAPGLGQGVAVVFGLSRSTADAMITMDVDGSHPVDVIPAMISGFLDGAQVVQCVRRTLANRKAYRRIGAAAFFFGARVLTGVDANEQRIYYRLVSAGVTRWLLQQPRYWHYLRFPLPRQPEGALRKIYVDTEERVLGESKYGFRRLVNLAIDGVLSQMPQSRLAMLLVGMGVMAALLVRCGMWPLSLLVAGAMAWLIRRYAGLSRPDFLQRMQVLESGNVAGSPTVGAARVAGAAGLR